MGRKDERSGTRDNNTTNVSEKRITQGWAAKVSGMKGGELIKEVDKLADQREAGGRDRN